jgi:hypothetical protein
MAFGWTIWKLKRLTQPPRLPPSHFIIFQVDLKPTDSKNELKKKVGKKVGIPFERLKMRLGKGPPRKAYSPDTELIMRPPFE